MKSKTKRPKAYSIGIYVIMLFTKKDDKLLSLFVRIFFYKIVNVHLLYDIPQYTEDHIGNKMMCWTSVYAVDVADGMVIIFDFDVFIYELLFVI